MSGGLLVSGCGAPARAAARGARRTLTQRCAKVNSRAAHFPRGAIGLGCAGGRPSRSSTRSTSAASRRSRSTIPRRATRSRPSCSAGLIAASSAPARKTRCAASCSPPRTSGRSPRAPTSAASRPTMPLVHKHFAGERFVALFKLIGELGKPTICAARGHVLAGALGIALACDLIVACEDGELRHARDQRRRVPVHDHGADLPQRAAQEGQRAAAARRALERAGGARSGDRQPVVPAAELDAAVATGRSSSPPSRP